MGTATDFQLLAVPQARSLASLKEGPLQTLIAGGIVNPFGPTLQAIVIQGALTQGATRPVLYTSLNPFSQEVSEIAMVYLGDDWGLETGLQQLLYSARFGSCPTFLLPNHGMHQDYALRVYARFLGSFNDGYSVLQGVRRFPGDPWKRVQSDVDRLRGGILRTLFGSRKGKDRRLTDAEATELAENLLEPKNMEEERKAFVFAWNGSIEFQGDSPMAKSALGTREFSRYLAEIAMSCRLPGVH